MWLQCTTDIAKSTLATGIALTVYAFFSLLDAITGLVTALVTMNMDNIHKSVSGKSIFGRIVRTTASFSGGAAVAMLSWLAFETFRDNMWSKMHAAAPKECDATLYSIVSISILVLFSCLAAYILLYALTVCLVCLCPAPELPYKYQKVMSMAVTPSVARWMADYGSTEDEAPSTVTGCLAVCFGLEEEYNHPETMSLLGTEEKEQPKKK
jgi:hypothetical protein